MDYITAMQKHFRVQAGGDVINIVACNLLSMLLFSWAAWRSEYAQLFPPMLLHTNPTYFELMAEERYVFGVLSCTCSAIYCVWHYFWVKANKPLSRTRNTWSKKNTAIMHIVTLLLLSLIMLMNLLAITGGASKGEGPGGRVWPMGGVCTCS